MKILGIPRIFVICVCTALLVLPSASDWTKVCPSDCNCKWVSGKKLAECKNKGLRVIPEKLSNEAQTLDLSGNHLDRLYSEAFRSVNLTSLNKINLQSCQIREVDRKAFSGLEILVELNLAENRIHALEPGTFKDNKLLRTLVLSNNLIQRIEANLFNLQFLQKLEIDHCLLSEIDNGAFSNIKNLLELKIEGNRLSSLDLKPLLELSKLRSFYFYDNPWNCDCHLRDIRNLVIERNLLTVDTLCVQPEKLKHKLWKDIEPNDFACKPEIIWPPVGKMIMPEQENIHLGCKVSGNPMPRVHWYHNSRIISDDSTVKYSANRYTISHDVIDYDGLQLAKWVNLTVHDVNVQDKGQFRCVAESPGGLDQRNITLVLEGDGSGVVGVAGYNIESWPLIIGLATGLTALIIIICIFVCCFCCRYRQSKSSKSSVSNSDKQDESLLAVNPIQKPPRCYDTQIPPDEGVESSELNTKLLDENSLHGTVCTSEGNQSAECLDSIPEDRNDAYPPDLLSFPSRRYNTSPAGSGRGLDPLRTPLSPGVHSLPPHRYNFGTLPYSRSHSPLSPGGPVVLPRQGYVTIPRRPRIPSWSSAPTPSLLDDPLGPILLEPIYDNLGPRTTADGSSVLSLNKSVPENPRRKKPSLPYYFHFESPCPSPLAAPEKDNNRKEVFKKPSITKNPLDTPATTPVKKIAPKPPPKPKKGGPLFEDEGEDGTEV